MKVGTIGSGVIVDRMIEAMKMTQGIEVCAVYSRTLLRAQEFAQKHHISKYYDDLDKMLNDDDLDTIYVASPNGLHYSQSKQALLAGKHVICEKPFVPTVQEAIDLFTIAKEKEVDNNVISAFKSHYGNGEYTLHITGTIDSVDIEKINHSINFKIAE